MRRYHRLAAACVLGVAATSLTTPAFAAPAAVTWTAPAGADYALRVRDAWTPERIANARPMEAPELSAAGEPVKVGPPGQVDPAPAAPSLSAITPTINGDGKAARWVDPSDPRFYESPASTTGILMFHNPLDGRDYMCSGSVVNSEATKTTWA